MHFDWIYADPDRRSAEGRKLVRLEDCSPDIIALKPLLDRVSGRLCIKNSPLFDIGEALRLFPDMTRKNELSCIPGRYREISIRYIISNIILESAICSTEGISSCRQKSCTDYTTVDTEPDSTTTGT